MDNDTDYQVDYSQYSSKPGNLKGEAKQKYEAKHSKELSEGERSKLESKPAAGIFYRSMGVGEYNAATAGDKKFDFNAAFKFTNTDLYRWWVTSSLAKAQAFENENVDKDTKTVIVQFNFGPDFMTKITKLTKLKAHQEKGVQGNSNVVAIHREGFMTSKLGSPAMNCDQHVTTVMDGQMAFNLGFTVKQLDLLSTSLTSIKRV